MSKEHAYAYEAGYRDGSIHYELEHCPACKNVADLQEALDENAKLRDERDRMYKANVEKNGEILRLLEGNAKLRELVRDMWHDGMCECDERGACTDCEYGYLGRMRELGVEVDG